MATIYNPSDLKTNCGFCSIARGLHVQQHKLIDADKLYEATLKRLEIPRAARDPLPRLLIFPEVSFDGVAISGTYSALAGRRHGLADYTITSVAEHNKLVGKASITDLLLPRQFMQFYANREHGTWSLRDFEEMRLDWLRDKGLNPTPESVRSYITKELHGHSIMGSKKTNHFINVHIDKAGIVTAYDAQDGSNYDGKGLNARLVTVDFFMLLR